MSGEEQVGLCGWSLEKKGAYGRGAGKASPGGLDFTRKTQKSLGG